MCVAGGRGLTHRQFDAIRHLMGYTYKIPSGRGQKGWRKRRFINSKYTFPVPICSKSISNFADRMTKASGLKEFGVECGGGAKFDANKIVTQLVSALDVAPTKVHIQVLGDGFRAMKSTSIVSVGARLLLETETEAGDTSFTAIGSL